MKYQIETLRDFSGGINNLLSNYEIKDNESVDIMNMSMTQLGVLEKRKGLAALNKYDEFDLAGGEKGEKIVGVYKYRKSNGEEFFLAIVKNTDFGKDVMYKRSGITWVKIYDQFTPSEIYNFETFNDKCYIVNGQDNLIIFDGTNVTEKTAETSPKTINFTNTDNWLLTETVEISGNLLQLKTMAQTTNQINTGDENYAELVNPVEFAELFWFKCSNTADNNKTYVGFQVSPDNGITWYYNKGGGWQPTDLAEFDYTTDIDTIQDQIWSLARDEGGLFKVRIFLKSNNINNNLTVQNIEFDFGIIEPGKFKYIKKFKNRMFYAGHPDYPNILFISELNNPELIGIYNWVKLQNTEGDKITGFASLYDVFVIFTSTKTFIFYGRGPIVSWILKELPHNIGCIDNKTIQNAENDIIFLSNQGLYSFNGNYFKLLTEKIPETIKDIIQSNNFASAYYRKHYYLTYYSNENYKYETLLYHYFNKFYFKYDNYKANIYYTDLLDDDLFFGRIDEPFIMETNLGNIDTYNNYYNFGSLGPTTQGILYTFTYNPAPAPIWVGFNLGLTTYVSFYIPKDTFTEDKNFLGCRFTFTQTSDGQAQTCYIIHQRNYTVSGKEFYLVISSQKWPDANPAFDYNKITGTDVSVDRSLLQYVYHEQFPNVYYSFMIPKSSFSDEPNFDLNRLTFIDTTGNSIETSIWHQTEHTLDDIEYYIFLTNDKANEPATINYYNIKSLEFYQDEPCECYWISKYYDMKRFDIDKYLRSLKFEILGSRGNLSFLYRLDNNNDWIEILNYNLSSGDLWDSMKWDKGHWASRAAYYIKSSFPTIDSSDNPINVGKRIQFKIYNYNTSDFILYDLMLKFKYIKTRL